MASKSGRKGELPYDLSNLLEHADTDDDTESESDGSSESNMNIDDEEESSPSTKIAIRPEDDNEYKKDKELNLIEDEGCKICKKDTDHSHMLLCEHCNGEYHTYCLDPPLLAIPDNDWYCDECSEILKNYESTGDGLEGIVEALGPEFSSRYGEICWAAGGAGFGWWPACIYDPRLTVSSARTLARRNAGKMHLVYFLECHDAPFTVLSSDQIVDWEVGLAWGYHEGVASRDNTKRGVAFDGALQQAMVEFMKPIDMRLDWNHHTNNGADSSGAGNSASTLGMASTLPPATRLSSAKKGRKKGGNASLSDATGSDVDMETSSQCSGSSGPVANVRRNGRQQHRLRSDLKFLNEARKLAKVSKISIPDALAQLSLEENARNIIGNTQSRRTNLQSALQSLCGDERSDQELANGDVLNCKIFVWDEGTTCVGFVTLPNRESTKFDECRANIEANLCGTNSEIPQNWIFFVPKLGPISLKQEIKLSVLPFLSSATPGVTLGDGSEQNPLRVLIRPARRYS